MAVEKKPAAYHTLTSYITVKNGERAMRFYEQALGAKEVMRFGGPDGKIAHAEMRIGDSVFMLSDEVPQMGAMSPETLGGVTSSLMVYVDDVDQSFKKAIDAGGKVVREVQDQFYGDRSGTFIDPEGHKWTLSTHVEDVSPEELKRRMANMFAA